MKWFICYSGEKNPAEYEQTHILKKRKTIFAEVKKLIEEIIGGGSVKGNKENIYSNKKKKRKLKKQLLGLLPFYSAKLKTK